MLTVGGKRVLTTPDEILDPGRAAVVVVDMQNDFCTPGGVFAQCGCDLTAVQAVIAPIARLLQGAREAGIRIVYLMMTTMPNYESWGASYIRFNLEYLNVPPGRLYTVPETWGWRVVDGLAPRGDEIVVRKWRSSGFIGTNLDLILKSYGIESLVICGTATYACVDSTLRDATHLDYYTAVPADCVAGTDADLHDAALRIMRRRTMVLESPEILRYWAPSAGKRVDV